MWRFIQHLQAFLLSATIIVTVINLKNNYKYENNISINSTKNNLTNFNYFYENHTKINENQYFKSKKKYRNLILGNRSRTDTKKLYILGLFELSNKYGIRSEGFSEVYAAQLAVDHINSKNILFGYNLTLLINDTECDPGAGIDRFFHAVHSNKTIIMLLGTSCSNVTETLANIVPYWNIVQISFGSTTPVLSDGNKFPLFFRTVTPDSSHNMAKSAFIRYYKWKTIATLSQRENTYILPLNNLLKLLESINISSEATVTFSLDNFKEQLLLLKELDVRIIIGSFSHEIAIKIFCEVYNLNMFGADYVWILQYQEVDWWKDDTICKNNQLKKATEGIIFISHYNVIPSTQISRSGLTNQQFVNELNLTRISKFVQQTYDAVWAMTLALESVITQYGYNLSEFYYDNDQFLDKIIQKMRSLRFMGLSGPVYFQGADRIANSVIQQIQDGELNNVAIYYPDKKNLSFNCEECKKVLWKHNRVPIAKRILRIKILKVPKFIFYIILIISSTGIVTCIFFLYFNFYYRKMKVVKLSSPRLNNITAIGCLLVYFAVILLGIDMTSYVILVPQLCMIKVYFLSAGFSLAFGSIFAKTYRIHRIFTYRCTSIVKDKILKDKQLISLILMLLVIDGIIVMFWIYIDPLQYHFHNLTTEINPEDRSVLYQLQVEECRCNNTSGWFIAIYGYKGFLLMMGVYMAWETRHIKVEGLNDSQYIGISVYSAVFSSLVVLLTNFLREYVILSYIAKTSSIIISVTLTLSLLFIPKLKLVFWDDKQDPIMQSMGLKIECNTRRLLVDDPKELTYRLEVQNKVYRCEIEALDREIGLLEEKLRTYESNSFDTDIITTKTSRASWPSTQFYNKQITRNNFLSENTLNEGNSISFGERLKIFDKLKKFFGRIPSVWLDFSNNVVMDEQIYDNTIISVMNENTCKANSMNVVSNNLDFETKTFFISIDENKFQT